MAVNAVGLEVRRQYRDLGHVMSSTSSIEHYIQKGIHKFNDWVIVTQKMHKNAVKQLSKPQSLGTALTMHEL